MVLHRLRGVWAKSGQTRPPSQIFDTRDRLRKAPEIWRDYADVVTGAEIPECGHFIPEEQPEALLAHLRPFPAGATTG